MCAPLIRLTRISLGFGAGICALALMWGIGAVAQDLSLATKRLFDAVWVDDLARVKASITAGADLTAVNELGVRPVDMAVDKGHYEIAHYLLSVERQRRENAVQKPKPTPRERVAARAVQRAPISAPPSSAAPSEAPSSGESGRLMERAALAPAPAPVSASAPAASAAKTAAPAQERFWTPGATGKSETAPALKIVSVAEPQPVAAPTRPAASAAAAPARAAPVVAQQPETPLTGWLDRMSDLFSGTEPEAASAAVEFRAAGDPPPPTEQAADEPASGEVSSAPEERAPRQDGGDADEAGETSMPADPAPAVRSGPPDVASPPAPAESLPMETEEAGAPAPAGDEGPGILTRLLDIFRPDEPAAPDAAAAVTPPPELPARTAPENAAEAAAADHGPPPEPAAPADPAPAVRSDPPDVASPPAPAESLPMETEEAGAPAPAGDEGPDILTRFLDIFRPDEPAAPDAAATAVTPPPELSARTAPENAAEAAAADHGPPPEPAAPALDPAAGEELPDLLSRLGEMFRPIVDTSGNTEDTAAADGAGAATYIDETYVGDEGQSPSAASGHATADAAANDSAPDLFARLFETLSDDQAEPGTKPATAEGSEPEPSGASSWPVREPEAAAALSGVRLTLADGQGLDRRAPASGEVQCVDKNRWNTVYCIESLAWPPQLADAFKVSSNFYRGQRSIVEYVAGRAAQMHVLFRTGAMRQIAEHFTARFGPPTETPEIWTALIGQPRRPNKTLRWRSIDPGSGEKTVLEIREIDDLRWSSPPDVKNGVVRLFTAGRGSVFKLLSSTDLLLVQVRRGR